MPKDKKMKTRFAPSPTGFLHIGGYRTALFNYLFAKQNDGNFILRIEDTDKERGKKEYEENILEGLNWLGLEPDEKFIQSQNIEKHKEILEKLLESGSAYISKEEEGERKEVVRFKNPNKKIIFKDLIRGEVTFDTEELGDFVIAKSLEEPLFHLAVVADDSIEGVTHIIRGEDHISNTPRQILIYESLGLNSPVYAHIPLILAKDKSKLSKRKGALPITEYRDQGFLPEAVLNYMALLGWNPGTDQEIFLLQELINQFNLEKVQKGASIFDEIKMRWVNQQHLHHKKSDEVGEYILKFATLSQKVSKNKWDIEGALAKIQPVILERIETYGDVTLLFDEGEFDFVFEKPKIIDSDNIVWKKLKQESPDEYRQLTSSYLSKVIETLEEVDENNWDSEKIKNSLWPVAEKIGRGEILWPTRYALTGKEKSPDPFVVAGMLGKDETIERIEMAIDLLKDKK